MTKEDVLNEVEVENGDDLNQKQNKEFEKRVKKLIDDFKAKGEKIIADDGELQRICMQAEEWLAAFPDAGEELKKVPTFIDMLRCYAIGSYKDISKAKLVAILFAVVYCVSPLDFIPDFVPVLGISDDAGVVGVVYLMARPDIEKYAEWRTDQKSA